MQFFLGGYALRNKSVKKAKMKKIKKKRGKLKIIKERYGGGEKI